jgi:hypothetical protein
VRCGPGDPRRTEHTGVDLAGITADLERERERVRRF